ncbi:MAG: glycosyl hydrolase family 59 [Oscillospiraceae bacterium]
MPKTKLIALAAALCFSFSAAPLTAFSAAQKPQTNSGAFEINIDGSTRNTAENSEWKGFGFISANNSSRLLLDYKAEHPDDYWDLLENMFDPEGAVRINHIKIELGADINSSSGTEPSTKRSADEKADVTRGAGFQLAADALTINPDITLELLAWGMPGYIKNAADIDEKRQLKYEWFKDTLDSAYETYGLEFQYIAPNTNERMIDTTLLKLFSKNLKSEKNTPYPYKDIKIVAADEDTGQNLALAMLRDEELMDAVDVIGVHYTSTSSAETQRCKNEYGKELWYSEGLSPASVAEYSLNGTGTGLGGINSTLDVAGRIINMYPNGGYTMYEFQPPVSAYYSGATYYPKQLATANDPWSGYIDYSSGMYMCEHFSLFSEKGWQFVDSACFGDGNEINHVLNETTNNYMTLSDPETDDYSVILANNTATERKYTFTVKNLKTASQAVQVWETRDPDSGGEYDSCYMKNIMAIEPTEAKGGEYTYQLTVKPYSMMTVTTLEASAVSFESEVEQKRLALPYTDDFEYADMDENYLSSRGYAPRYTTDIGGAFEVVEDETDGRILMQKITEETKGQEWGASPDPVTTLGDDSWANYTVSSKVRLEALSGEECYAGIGLRYINSSAAKSMSGYRIIIYGDGKWELSRLRETLAEGRLDSFNAEIWHTLSITAFGDNLTAAIDGVQVAAVTLENDATVSGRAALFSSYNQNCFDELSIMPTDMTPYIVRIDELDSAVKYKGGWEHNVMDSFTCHNRTASYSVKGEESSFEFSFSGDSLALIGTAESAEITVELDGDVIADKEKVSCGTARSAMWHKYSLGMGEHKAKITVNSGLIGLDAIEFGSNSVNIDGTGGDIVIEEQPTAKLDQTEQKTSKKILAASGIAAAALIGLAVFGRKRHKK